MPQRIRTQNPATEEFLKIYSWHSPSIIENRIKGLHKSQTQWSSLSYQERFLFLKAFASELLKAKDDLARQITLEMGKPLGQSMAEIDKCLSLVAFLENNSEKFFTERDVSLSEGQYAHIIYRPYGVLLGIMPWNFPLWQVLRFALPALMGGNVIALKHDPHVAGVAELIEKLFLKSFGNFKVYSNLRIQINETHRLMKDSRIQGVSLTGSTRAGRSIGETAGREIKKSVLELGGSDPYLIFEDASLEAAAEVCLRARLVNGGQSCVSAKRFIVVKSIYKKFEEIIFEKIKKVEFGDPFDLQTQLGPLARRDLRQSIHRQVQASVRRGARLLWGGSIPNQMGFYYPLSLLTRVRPGQSAFNEETFGPIFPLIQAEDEKQAIHYARQSSYALGAAVFSQDEDRARKLISPLLPSMMIGLNQAVRSDPGFPFGGSHHSGYGRELGIEGVHEWVQTQTLLGRTKN